ncbi:MAG: hypothetical protein JXR19_02930 [Bacteroidia bacterium]
MVAIKLVLLFFQSEGLQGGMDSYNHYLIAKYSFKHPALLLDYWGKPVYNFIASPFTQFGLAGSVYLNIFCLLGSAYFCFKIAKILGSKIPLLAFFLCLLSPIFLDHTISSLTEPLNAFLLSWTLYLMASNRILAGALLAGFLPFARSEGFIIAAVIGLYLILFKKNYKAVLFLLLGSVILNFAGWIIEGKPFWIITENPYLKFELSGDNICGSGSFIHYFRWGHVTFGLITCLLLVISIVYAVKDTLAKKANEFILLITTVFIAYFGAHALIWGLGMMGSCGYIRVMTVVAPIAAILAAVAFERFMSVFNKKVHWVVLILLLANAIYAPYKYYEYRYPVEISQEQKEFTKVYNWLKNSEYSNDVWAYMYPYLSLISDRDPWDKEEHIELWSTSLPYMDKGTIIIWDAHFGQNEGQIAPETLMENPEYELIQQFKPEESFTTQNNYPFHIMVFKKLSAKKES